MVLDVKNKTKLVLLVSKFEKIKTAVFGPVWFMNMDVKVLNKMLAVHILQYINKGTWPWPRRSGWLFHEYSDWFSIFTSKEKKRIFTDEEKAWES